MPHYLPIQAFFHVEPDSCNPRAKFDAGTCLDLGRVTDTAGPGQVLRTWAARAIPKGLIVAEAVNGQEALVLFAPGHFDLVMTNYAMPVMNWPDCGMYDGDRGQVNQRFAPRALRGANPGRLIPLQFLP